MRAVLALLLLGVALTGCSDGTTSEAQIDSGFQDLGAQASSTTGVILGVVVDDAIRPVKDVAVGLKLPAGEDKATTSDAEGRFAFSNLQPGTYFLSARHPQFTAAQSSVEVVAGVDSPPVMRLQITRLFDQEPFSQQIKYDGYLACAISVPVGTTCVNDYTRLIPQCNGGCLRDYNVSQTAGNVREYVTPLGAGWQEMVFEMAWEPTLTTGTSDNLGLVVSYYARPGASHFYMSEGSSSPLRAEIVLGETPVGQQDEPELIPPEGIPDLFVFFGAGGSYIVLNQAFQSFQTNFFYGIPPDGWSLVAGDPLPF